MDIIEAIVVRSVVLQDPYQESISHLAKRQWALAAEFPKGNTVLTSSAVSQTMNLSERYICRNYLAKPILIDNMVRSKVWTQ